jgi:hypothetical protein
MTVLSTDCNCKHGSYLVLPLPSAVMLNPFQRRFISCWLQDLALQPLQEYAQRNWKLLNKPRE